MILKSFKRIHEGDDLWLNVDDGTGTARKRAESDGFWLTAEDGGGVFLSDDHVTQLSNRLWSALQADMEADAP